MGGRGSSSGLNIDTSGLSGVQVDALNYYQENGEWPKGLSAYQRSKLSSMIEDAQGYPKASTYKDNGLSRVGAENKFKSLYNSTPHSRAEEAAKEQYMMYADEMNASLRGNGFYNNPGAIKAMRKSMTVNNSDETLYRGLNGSRLGIKPGESVESVRGKLVGRVRADKGFVSSSMSHDVAKEFSARGINEYKPNAVKTIMVINPKGGKTTLVKSGLSEVVFDTKTKFQYTDVKKKGDTYYVYVRVHK